jgi:hypothetical protein
MAALPILIPSFLTLVIVRLSLDARSSRSRIRLLEKDETYRERLAHVVGDLEKHVEDVVADYMEDVVGPSSAETLVLSSPPADASASASASASLSVDKVTKTGRPLDDSSPSVSAAARPTVTPLQRKIVASLNTLPNLKKELAYIHPLMNSHAVIIARDVKKFPHHEQGHGVLRHMADNFVM